MEALEDGDKPPKLLKIHVLSKGSRQQVGGAKDQGKLKTEPTVLSMAGFYLENN